MGVTLQNAAAAHELQILFALEKLSARKSFASYIRFMEENYFMGWFHRELAEALNRFSHDVIARKAPRLIIEAPPRHGKSTQASRLLPTYLLGLSPDLEILSTSYGDAIAFEFCADVQKVMDSEKYHALFPETIIPGIYGKRGVAKRAADHFGLIGKRGHYRAAGLFSALTGRGADVLIVDDPFKGREDSQSPTQRSKIWNNFTATAMTRIHKGGGIVIIATRWHEDDLIGRIESDKEGAKLWHRVNFPAIAVEDEPHRKKGEALCPQLKSLAELVELRRSMSVSQWSAMYQQAPSPEEGGLLKKVHWRYWQPEGEDLPPVVVEAEGGKMVEIQAEPLPKMFERSIQSWDLNFGGTRESDFVVGLIIKSRGAKRFILDRFKARADFTETIHAMRSMMAKYPECSAKYVEKAANGTASMNLLENTYGITGLIPVPKDKNKFLYADTANDQLRAGNWYLPHPMIAPWVEDFLFTLTMFPNAKHDDDVDAWSQAAIKMQSSARLDVFLKEIEVV
jgi:predicted phage terminase large subunit-like protein